MKNKVFPIAFLLLFSLFYFIQAKAQSVSDFLVNEQGSINGAKQSRPSVNGDGNGNFVITWRDNRNGCVYDFDIFAQIFINDGIPLGSNFKVNDDERIADQCYPSVAVDPNLNFIIAWIEKSNNNEWNVYCQRFSNNGSTLGSNFKVNDNPGTFEKEQTSVSIDSCGNFVIVWSDKRNANWDIYAQRFSNDGIALGNNFKINDDAGNSFQYWPASSCDKSGNMLVCWADTRINSNNRDIFAQRFSSEGTALGNNFKVNTDITGSNHIRPGVALDGNGNFIIAWEDNRNGNFDIFAQRYLNDGSTQGDNFKINDDTNNTSQFNPSISSDFEGNFTVCWENNYTELNDIYARRFSNEGIPLGANFKVSSDSTDANQFNSDIYSDNNGNFKICWEDHRLGYKADIFAQAYLNDGTVVEENFKVNDDEKSENQENPSIAIDSSENFIIAWVDHRTENAGIYAQRYTSDGTALGNNIKVNDDTLNNHTLSPSVAISLDGSFVITWADFRIDEIYNIYAQRFSSDGIALGSNFRVNYLSGYLNYCPVVVCKQNGDFIICWGDAGSGGYNKDYYQHLQNNNSSMPEFISENSDVEPDIWAQQFLSDGTPIGENFKVNDNSGFTYQQNPDIAIDTSGNFVISWDDTRNDFYEIFIQRYLSDGTPLGNNFKVEEVIYSDYQVGSSIASDPAGNFTVTWRENRNNSFDIFCRRFSNDGNPIGNSFQVNNDSGNINQSNPYISINKNGNFIITWFDKRNGNNDVYAQRFLSNGIPFGSNYMVPCTNVLDQSAPAVALGKNVIYTTWQDNSNGQTGYDILANIMDWEVFEQEISLLEGFQFVSSNINPVEPDMLVVLEEILNDNLNFVRNSSGETLQKIGPAWINGIGDWIVSEGYLIKMFAYDSFSINGYFVDPLTPIFVEQGFQFVSYFPENPMDALLAFETIMDDNLDYIRNSQGQTLRKIGPIWVNGIGDCQPGEGYLVKMFSEGEIIYPASAKSSHKTIINPTYFSFEGGNAADPVYTIFVNGLEIGDEVAAFDGDKMIGSVKINSQNTFENELPVFSTLTSGQGYEEDNPIILKVWSENNIVLADFTMEAMYDSYVSDVYPDGDGKYSIVNITKGLIENTEETIFVYPNPSKGIFNISIEGVIGTIQIKVLDLIGKEYSHFELNGSTLTQLDLTELSTGVYFISFNSKNLSEVKKIVIR